MGRRAEATAEALARDNRRYRQLRLRAAIAAARSLQCRIPFDELIGEECLTVSERSTDEHTRLKARLRLELSHRLMFVSFNQLAVNITNRMKVKEGDRRLANEEASVERSTARTSRRFARSPGTFAWHSRVH